VSNTVVSDQVTLGQTSDTQAVVGKVKTVLKRRGFRIASRNSTKTSPVRQIVSAFASHLIGWFIGLL